MTEAASSRPQAIPSISPRPLKTIAFITNMVTTSRMSHYLLAGLADQARAENLNLIVLPGNAAHLVVGFEYHLQSLNNLLSPHIVHGLIIWGSGILGSTSRDNLRRLFECVHEFPIVNVGLALEDYPNVILDNYRGMYDAVRHLIQAHGCRRIVFIRGPVGHDEAEARYQAYQNALRENGLPFDPLFVLQGSFRREDGSQAIADLLNARRAAPDAIVASNDLMAFGAHDELTAREISVPGMVRLIGFDDLEDGRYLPTPLTTVRQPFYEMGQTAVKILTRKMIDPTFRENTTVPSVLIIRESCGCADPLLQELEKTEPLAVASSASDYQAGVRKRIETETEQEFQRYSIDPSVVRDVALAVADSFWKEMQDGQKRFLPALTRALDNPLVKYDSAILNTMITFIRRITLPFFMGDARRLVAAENRWQSGRILINEFTFRSAFAHNNRRLFQNQLLQEINLLLITTLNLSDFMNLLARQLPRMGIRSCFLSLYDDPDSFRWSRLMLGYSEERRIDLDPRGVRFPTAALVPEGMLPRDRQTMFSIQPLYSGDMQLGFFLFEERAYEMMTNEVMRAQLSMAVRGALLFQEKEKLLADLEHHAVELQMTTDGLARSNAELEQFAYIASHDLQEPLRKISLMADRLNSDFEAAASDQGKTFIGRIQTSCLRMKTLIDDLLAYSRLTSQALNYTRVEVTQIIRDILSDLEPRIESEKAVIHLHDLPVIDAEPQQMQQLFQNLISNALKFHKLDHAPSIDISGATSKEGAKEFAEIVIADDGIGIDRKYFDRIFIVFQRLHGPHQYDGTGIGLAVCKKVIERHGGSIRVESEPGKGSRFIVRLPVKQFLHA